MDAGWHILQKRRQRVALLQLYIALIMRRAVFANFVLPNDIGHVWPYIRWFHVIIGVIPCEHPIVRLNRHLSEKRKSSKKGRVIVEPTLLLLTEIRDTFQIYRMYLLYHDAVDGVI